MFDVSPQLDCAGRALILDRPRHQELINAVRAAGARIRLISDGDVAGVIATSRPESGIDIYMGTGGAPEGVLAAAALRCIGGQFQGRLLFRNEDEKARARRMGVTDLDRVYDMNDLAKGDVMFTATGVTGILYMIVAGALGLGFLAFALRPLDRPSPARWAYRLFFASLVYLPVLVLALAVDVLTR